MIPFLVMAATLPPIDLEPFMDERAAGRALEVHMACLGKAVFERRDDRREAGAVATEAVGACATQATKLRVQLTGAYRRKANLLPLGTNPEQAADRYVKELNGRIEPVILEMRARK
jgi:hypothetical protein